MAALWPVIVINSDSSMSLIPCELNLRSLPSIICQHGTRWHWRIVIYIGSLILTHWPLGDLNGNLVIFQLISLIDNTYESQINDWDPRSAS